MSVLSRGSTFAALLLTAACGDVPLAPQSIHGAWVLRHVGDQPAPTVLSSGPAVTILLTADTLVLHADRTFDGVRCEQRIDHVLDQTSTHCAPYSGVFAVHVREITLVRHCQAGSLCLGQAMLTARLSGDRFVIDGDGDAPSLVYERSAP